MILRDVAKARIVRQPGILAPRWRVGHQGIPEGEANQRPAVLHLRPCLACRRVILRFRQEGEPAGEVLTVLGAVEAGAVRESIAQAIAPGGAKRSRTGQGIRAHAVARPPRAIRQHLRVAENQAGADRQHGEQCGASVNSGNSRWALEAGVKVCFFHGLTVRAHSKCRGHLVQGLSKLI